MNERAERINGWAAMLGVIAAMGAYAVTGQVIPGVWWYVSPISNIDRSIYFNVCFDW